MTTYRPRHARDVWTLDRQRWLETLERGPAKRPQNPVGFQCMQLGWTDWRRTPDGRSLGEETLTDAGRAKLEEWRTATRAADAETLKGTQ